MNDVGVSKAYSYFEICHILTFEDKLGFFLERENSIFHPNMDEVVVKLFNVYIASVILDDTVFLNKFYKHYIN